MSGSSSNSMGTTRASEDLLSSNPLQIPLNQSVEQVQFDPKLHLVSNGLTSQTRSATMTRLALPTSALSDTAFTGPFPLLTPEAVSLHRRDILQQKVLDNCMSQTWPSSVQIRGVAPTYSTFIHQFWNSDEVKKVVSQAAGAELEPVMDYEICHANIQVKPPQASEGKSALEQIQEFPIDIGSSSNQTGPLKVIQCSNTSITPELPDEADMVVEWHKDCYPFVVIVMLSDPKGMSGGETVVRKGDGSLLFVKAPEMGQALVFQGGSILHAALPTVNSSERITLVTSFRPKSSHPNALTCDISHLGNVRRYSRLSELYKQWYKYRLDFAMGSMQQMQQNLDDESQQTLDSDGNQILGKINVAKSKHKKYIADLIAYLNKTSEEMVDEGE